MSSMDEDEARSKTSKSDEQSEKGDTDQTSDKDDSEDDGEDGDDESSFDTSSSTSSKPIADISSSQRIRELMAIDAEVTQILRSAGEAIKILTAPTAPASDDATPVEASQEAFAARTRDYTVAAQSVAARLRRQIYALEEANIITRKPERAAPTVQAARQPARPLGRLGQPATQRQEPQMQITNGGLGKLDVGWLNSRSDRVGKQKEAELWAQAREHLQGMMGNGDANDDDMEVDDIDDNDDGT